MQLHPRHVQGRGGPPMPVSLGYYAAPRAERPRALAGLATQAAAECEKVSARGPGPRVTLDREGLAVEGGGSALRVPALHAEVAHAPAGQGLQPSVIAVAPARAATGAELAVWLIVVEGGKAALRSQLRALGERGAVRGDAREELRVTAKPFSVGVSAMVHEARALPALHECGGKEVHFAAKVVSLSDDHDESKAAKAAQEVELLLLAQATPSHPNIIRLRGVFCCGAEDGPDAERQEESGAWPDPLRQPCHIVITDLCRRGDLHHCILHRGVYLEAEAMQLAADVLSALMHIHGRCLVHRDVKAENVLLGRHGEHILTDFGISARTTDAQAMQATCGTPGYAAPELVSGLPYGKKVDVFGTGVVLYFSLLVRTPFVKAGESNMQAVVKRTKECNVHFPSDPALTAQMQNFILILMTKDPEDRPTAKGAMDIMLLLDIKPAGRRGGRDAAPAAAQEEIAPPELPGSVQAKVKIKEGSVRAAAGNEVQSKQARSEPRTPQLAVPPSPSSAAPKRRPGRRFGLSIFGHGGREPKEEHAACRFVEEDGREGGDAGEADAHGGPGDAYKSSGSRNASKRSPSSSSLEEGHGTSFSSPIFPSEGSYASVALNPRSASKHGSASSSSSTGGSTPRRFLQRLLSSRGGRSAPGGSMSLQPSSSSAPSSGSAPSGGPLAERQLPAERDH